MLFAIGIGDNVCDKYLKTGQMYPGGQALNFAVFAHRLGASSAYIGVFGRDEVSAAVIAALDAEGVDRGRCRQYDGENGFAMVDIVDGERVFVGSNKGGVAKEQPLELSADDLEYIRRFDLAHTSNNARIDGQLASLAATGVLLSYDFSGSWKDPGRVRSICSKIEFAFFSCGSVPVGEVEALCSEAVEAGCGVAIATMGGAGAMAYDGSDFYRQAPIPTTVVDTLGAGDSFAAGFLVSLSSARKERLRDAQFDTPYLPAELGAAMQQGARSAMRTCGVMGAFGYGTPFSTDAAVWSRP